MYRLVLYLSIAAALAARSSRVLCEWLSTLDCRVLTLAFLSFSSFSKEIQENLSTQKRGLGEGNILASVDPIVIQKV